MNASRGHPRRRRLLAVGASLALVGTVLQVGAIAPANAQESGVTVGDTATSGDAVEVWPSSSPSSAGVAAPTLVDMSALPTSDSYADEKAAANAAAATATPEAKPGAAAPDPLGAPINRVANKEGLAKGAEGFIPPDTHMAVGRSQTLEVTNVRLRVQRKADLFVQLEVDLDNFFGQAGASEAGRPIFDPRVVYDPAWERWIIVAVERSPNASTPGRIFVAVSRGFSASANYWVYVFNPGNAAGDWLDYPGLGFDQDAVIVSGNIFTNASSYVTTRAFGMAKARIYNGLGFGAPVFNGLLPTIQPPILQQFDQNETAYLASADIGSDEIHLYACKDFANPGSTTCVATPDVAFPSVVGVPPDAPQPGTAALLDTLDGRFLSNSSQVGNFLWQVHTVGSGSFAIPRFYQINLTTFALANSGFWFVDGDSQDFNASIAANEAQEAFVTWSATFGPGNGQAEVRTSGRLAGDPAGSMNAPGTQRFQSAGFYDDFTSPERWGDYSSVALDPRSYPNGGDGSPCPGFRTAWSVNQKNNAVTTWGSWLTRFSFCSPL